MSVAFLAFAHLIIRVSWTRSTETGVYWSKYQVINKVKSLKKLTSIDFLIDFSLWCLLDCFDFLVLWWGCLRVQAVCSRLTSAPIPQFQSRSPTRPVSPERSAGLLASGWWTLGGSPQTEPKKVGDEQNTDSLHPPAASLLDLDSVRTFPSSTASFLKLCPQMRRKQRLSHLHPGLLGWCILDHEVQLLNHADICPPRPHFWKRSTEERRKQRNLAPGPPPGCRCLQTLSVFWLCKRSILHPDLICTQRTNQSIKCCIGHVLEVLNKQQENYKLHPEEKFLFYC